MSLLKLALWCFIGSVFSASVFGQTGSMYLGSLDEEIKAHSVFDESQQAKQLDYSASLLNESELEINRFDVRRDDLPVGLTPAQFATMLQKNFMGSYYYFKMLDVENQRKIYQLYLGNPKLGSIRSAIVLLANRGNDNNPEE